MGLLNLSGSQGDEVLARAKTVARNPKMVEAIERLEAVGERLAQYGVGQHFDIDLADVRGMDYYTGITFKAYTSTDRFFGRQWRPIRQSDWPFRPRQARRRLRPLSRPHSSGPAPSIWPAQLSRPDLLVHPCTCGGYVQLAEQARAAGRVVAIALGPEPPGLSSSLRCTCDGNIASKPCPVHGQFHATIGCPIPAAIQIPRLCLPLRFPKVV